MEPIIDGHFAKNVVLDEEKQMHSNKDMEEQINEHDSVESLGSATSDQNGKGRNLKGAAGTSNGGKNRTKNQSQDNAAARIQEKSNEKLPHKKHKSHKKKEKKGKKSKKGPNDDDNSDDEYLSDFFEVQDKRENMTSWYAEGEGGSKVSNNFLYNI